MQIGLVGCMTLAAVALLPVGAIAQKQPQAKLLFDSDSAALSGGVALSKDGRWLALSIRETPGKASLWIQRVGGGPLQRLTSSGQLDIQPQFSPADDRIYFASNRAARTGEPGNRVMVIPLNNKTGQAAGEPRQVTLDAISGGWRLSPDGKQIAYIDAKDRRLLKVVPAAGGTARLVTEMPAGAGVPTWSKDALHLAFVATNFGQGTRTIYRVSMSSGEMVAIARDLPTNTSVMLGPGADYYASMDNSSPLANEVEIRRLNGDVVTTVTVNRGARPVAFTSDGRGFLSMEDNSVHSTRVLPVAGGTAREVTQPAKGVWVAGWAPDASAVDIYTVENGQLALARVPVAGGQKQVFLEQRDLRVEGISGRHVIMAARPRSGQPRKLVALDTRDNSRHTITESAHGGQFVFPAGPGGAFNVREPLLFLESNGERVQIKEWSGPGRVRTIRSVPRTALRLGQPAVHGDMIAWGEQRGDSVDLFLARGAEQPLKIMTVTMMPTLRQLAFSTDGRWLASNHAARPMSTEPQPIAIVDVAGREPPRIINTGLAYWYWPRWLPDNSGILVVGSKGAEPNVYMIPLRDGAQPVDITRDERASIVGFELSPDGQFIAYPAETWKGTRVWKYDLGTVITAGR